MIGRLLALLRAPGFVRDGEYREPSAGLTLSVRSSPRYTIITVSGKEFYFLRESGRFDGTGLMSVNDPFPLSDYQQAKS